MISPEERQSIIDEAVEKAVEKALLALPDTWSNLVIEHKNMSESATKFYEKYPKFLEHKETVAAALAEVDGEHPFLKLDEKYDKAAPIIKKRIKMKGQLDMENVNPKPDLTFHKIESPTQGGNGVI